MPGCPTMTTILVLMSCEGAGAGREGQRGWVLGPLAPPGSVPKLQGQAAPAGRPQRASLAAPRRTCMLSASSATSCARLTPPSMGAGKLCSCGISAGCCGRCPLGRGGPPALSARLPLLLLLRPGLRNSGAVMHSTTASGSREAGKE
jgi:hypothetical protein